MLMPWNTMFWMKAKKIMVVDDDPNVRATVNKILELFGYSVVTSSSGKEALNIVADVKPELIILDINMPEMDGIAVLEKLKANLLTKDIPVIFLTANYIKPDHCVIRYAEDYITKPFSRKELLDRIEKVLYKKHKGKK